MTTSTHTLGDSAVMVRRNLLHQRRYPSVTLMLAGTPVVILLLFVYIFGGTLGAGLGNVAGGRAEYIAYVVPGILLMAVASVAQGTSISVATDMTEGIIARFRTMAISRAAVLTGHVVGAMVQTMIGIVLVLGVAVAMGFRPSATVLGWIELFGLLALVSFAFTWLAVGLGMAAGSVETASNSPMFLLILPFLSSGFVPAESMPAGMQWFAEHQPFTPMIETVRALLAGTPAGTDALVSVAWCAVIAVGSFLWARGAYERRSVR